MKLLGPADLSTGIQTDYELQVINSDRIALSGLILRMETPPGVEVAHGGRANESIDIERADDGASLLTWTVEQVNAGAQARLPLQLKASAARNFAVAIEWTVLPQAGMEELQVKQADLQIALEGPVDVEKDIANIYRLRVSNPGNTVARNVKVQVTAASKAASQIDIGDLDAGQTEVVEMDLTFEKAGRVDIGAKGIADGGLSRGTNIAVNVRQAILEALVSMPTSVPHGSPMVATVQLKNVGDAAARKLDAGLMLPAGSEVAQLPSGVTREGNKLLWSIESIPAGQVVTVPIEFVMPSPGTHEVQFACVLPSGAATTAQAATIVEAFADLKLIVNDPTSPAAVGTPVPYELTITTAEVAKLERLQSLRSSLKASSPSQRRA